MTFIRDPRNPGDLRGWVEEGLYRAGRFVTWVVWSVKGSWRGRRWWD